ncbi:MAG: GNAT family N-acetyltransferase [Ruminiclostridium sp.]
MNIKLKDVNKSNWTQCINIEPSVSQRHFIGSPVSYFIAQSKYEKWMKPIAIYNNNEVVGFLQYGFNKELDSFWIIGLVIDEKYQRNGYGKQALLKLLHLIKEKRMDRPVYAGHKPDNYVMENILKSIGFSKSDYMLEGHVVQRIWQFDEVDKKARGKEC